jgi:hypothetical protein
MAFTAANWIANETANTNAGDVFQYKEDNTLSNMSAQSYFDAAAVSLGLKDGDTILMIGSDGVAYKVMEIASGVVDVTNTSYISSTSMAQVIVTGATLSPTVAQSGTTFVLARLTGVIVTLPAVAVGLKYTFIHGTPITTSNGHVITATSEDINGSFVLGGAVQLVAAADTITFVNTTSILGDQCTIEADATNWYCSGIASTDNAILGSDET